ncbi:hypothetical protein V6N13_070335 [Hibiscus sabdariffa]
MNRESSAEVRTSRGTGISNQRTSPEKFPNHRAVAVRSIKAQPHCSTCSRDRFPLLFWTAFLGLLSLAF